MAGYRPAAGGLHDAMSESVALLVARTSD